MLGGGLNKLDTILSNWDTTIKRIKLTTSKEAYRT